MALFERVDDIAIKTNSPSKLIVENVSKKKRSHITMKDLLHGYMELPTIIVQIIDTPIVQRLRHLKQLGLCSYVYPSAEHCRFIHSIGTCHLAGLMMTTLQKKQPEIEITDREVELVMIAGLCHDLGHGPYSHTFESWLHRKGISFHHEDMSIKLFKLLVQKYNIPLTGIEIDMICHMILGDIYNPEREFMYQIVNDKNASIDVDKFDYLTRDCRMTNKQSSFNAEQLIQNCRVISGKLCYNFKERHTIYSLFRTRYDMFKEIYLHKAVKAIELMLMDALDHIDKSVNFINYINDPNEYIKLTDNFITYWVEFELMKNPEDVDLLAAKSIFTSMQVQRKIYKNVFIQQWTFHNNQKSYLTEEKIKEEVLIRTYGKVKPEDIRVEILTLNYGLNDLNPVNSVRFYNKTNYDRYYKINDDYDGVMIPKTFIEYYVRLYMTCPDDLEKRQNLLTAFIEFARQHGQVIHQLIFC
jgi:HD superfamily phosphohydrolase